MSAKRKGIEAERELIHLFNGTREWSAVRIAGSGSSKYPSPDILAGNIRRKLAIECKMTKGGKKYLTKEEVGQLREFSRKFGTESWMGIRFKKEPWYFLMLDDLEESRRGFIVSRDLVRRRGLLFEELIEKGEKRKI